MRQRKTQEEWQDVVRMFVQSGQTAIEYAEAHDLSPSTLGFYKWKYTVVPKREPKPQPTKELPVSTSEAICGYRQAAEMLGVSMNAIRRRLTIDAENPNALSPTIGQSRANQEGRVWRDFDHLKEWYNQPRMGRPLEVSGPRKKPSEAVMSVIEALGEDLATELMNILAEFNTPSNKRLRVLRGDPEEVSLDEVVTMVLGVGIVNWKAS